MSTAIESSLPNILPELQEPDAQTRARLALISKAEQMANTITDITVVSAESYVSAGETLKMIKGLRGELTAVCRPYIDQKVKEHKEALAEFKRGDGPLERAELSLKSALLSWDRKQEEIRRKEQARLQKEAEDRANEEARKAAEEAQIQAAIEAERAGNADAAKEIMEQPVVAAPVFVAPVVLPTITPKVEGLSKRQVWKCEVTDLMALVKAVAAGTIPLAAIEANTVFLGQQARSLKTEMRYPGVKVWPEDSLSGRA